MVNNEDSNKNPENPSTIQAEITESENLFSPGFRSVAAMAGWDEEALLIASLTVEDTPDRQPKYKKRSDLHTLKTPPSHSRRKRRAQRRSPVSIPVAVLDLDEDLDDSTSKLVGEKHKGIKESNSAKVEKNTGDDKVNTKGSNVPTIPCIDRVREELSCAICLEICYEPSTTPCGHSFCKGCLGSATDKCGKKCPKCRHLISNGKYCKVNTVLWNTIQLLFPQEVEARKTTSSAAAASDSNKPQRQSPGRTSRPNARYRLVQALNSPESERRSHRIRIRSSRPTGISSRGNVSNNVRTELPIQDEDAALALRLQREEYVGAFRVSDGRRSSLAVARANLRAMASRAVGLRHLTN
ncbi:hypothetical protein ACJIZ3_019780 [Penstemon smallii]|uniref:RING-type E3 ubiquitin transferase n=1 Tax=Penstemon smallii TaxID=265156 RepID=A0ABD3T2U1_9LAMI